ncbi:NAD(P)H-quinone oxidoreductase [Jonesiaceae bacterium BS-20]|uniref:NAD(P)H-quinone oxidoreductase n=1 Tax=Jonesiaceae bacterium BS-20 TaxID=3120821 RepID=A0AAU7DVP7_9MICO
MRAIVVSQSNPSSGPLSVSRIPSPKPGPNEVLITVAAAGINRADLLQAKGLYPPPPGASDVLGLEVSGTVTGKGAGGSNFHLGDQVVALLDSGGYADKVVAPAAQVLPLPKGVDLIEAAGIMEAACTAWSNLHDVAKLRPGQTVLIHGGSGGVGSFAIQLAKNYGVQVIATARTAERAERCRELGADYALAYGEYQSSDGDTFATRLPELVGAVTQDRGADVILDVTGASLLEANINALAVGGRLVIIGMQRGAKANLNLGTLLMKRASIHGTTLRSRPSDEKARIVAAVRELMWPALTAQEITPVIHAQFPLGQAQAAHDLLNSGEVFGKLLLVP